MKASGREPSPVGVAQCYSDFLDVFLIAEEDRNLAKPVAAANIQAICTNIRMRTLSDKRRLAREVLALVEK